MPPTDPRPYLEWRTDEHRRAEDAAHTFGAHLMRHCRQETLDDLDSAPLPACREELRALLEKSVDTALHNVMDLLEGFFRTTSGTHRVSYELAVHVKDPEGDTIERISLSPCKLDLPIGYWGWKDGER